jgi:ABC-type transport system involved in cytochrome c biogenesis permease component
VLLLVVVYPILVALLVAVALQNEDHRPSVAIVNQDSSGRSVEVGGRRLSVDDYVHRLSDDVDVSLLSAQDAQDALDAGRVGAVLTIPDHFIADLQSGVRQPVLRLATSRRSPIEADAIQQSLEAALYRLNQSLALGYVDSVLRLVDLVVNGGRIGFFGRSGDALGLQRSRALVLRMQQRLRAGGELLLATQLGPLLNFIDETQNNLDLAKPAANAIRAPIELDVVDAPEGRAPLSAFGFAAALLVSLGLAGILLGASVMSTEREEATLTRLGRGLVSPWSLVAEKTAFTASVCIVVGLILLGVVAGLTDLAVGRWGLWIATLLLTGLAFGAFGVVAGALAREARTALLAVLMIGLPLIGLSVLPGAPAKAVAQIVPFGPAFDAFQTLLVEPTIPGADLARTLGQLALLALVFGGGAALIVRRRVVA